MTIILILVGLWLIGSLIGMAITAIAMMASGDND